MSLRPFHPALVLVAALAVACNSQTSNTDQRLAELEQQLAETQKQLADAQATTPGEQAASPVAPAAAPATPPAASAAAASARSAAPVAARPAASAPRRTAAPASQRSTARDQVARDNAETKKLIEQQQAESARLAQSAQQAETAKQAESARQAETRQLIEQQQAENVRQAETITELRQQIDQLKPREVTLPVGTVIAVRSSRELSTASLSDGSTFDALLDHDLKSGNTVVASSGARVTGFVVESDRGGRVKGTASLTVGVRSIVGVNSSVIAVTTDSHTASADNTKKRDAIRTGVATGVGAIIGGIAGGGSGAAIGAGAGAAAGVGTNVATRGEAAVIPAEELMEFRLTAPVTVVMTP
jgi:hypothetical protein